MTSSEQAPKLHLLESPVTVNREVFDEVMPILLELRAKSQILKGNIPDNHPVFPSERVLILPDPISRYDPSELGRWEINIGEHTQARLHTLHDPSVGTMYIINMKTSEGKRPATQVETQQIESVLKLIPSYVQNKT